MKELDQIRAQLSQSGVALVTMRGDSMRPLLRDGQSVIVKAINPAYVKRFDVVLLAGSDRLLCHFIRHIEVRDGQKVFLTKGIANDFLDPAFKPTDVLGVVAVRLPWWLRLKHSVGDLIRNR